MGLYTETDKQTDKYYAVVSLNKSLSKQKIHLKVLVLLLFISIVFVIYKKWLLLTSHYQTKTFSFFACCF